MQRIRKDPLIWKGGFRARHSYVLLESTDNLQDGILLKNIKVPVLIFQGAQDKLVNPDGAKFLYQSISSEDKKLFVVKGAFHNLFVELDEVKIPVIKTTVDWILEHV